MPSLPDTGPVIGWLSCVLLPNPAPQTNALPAQEPGTKPARALPYQPNGYADRLVTGSGGQAQLWLDMANTGFPAAKAAHFAVYANAYRGDGPWQYTVDPGGTTSDYFNIGTGFGDGKYDLTMVGPNRFLRRFTGDIAAAGAMAEVRSSYAVEPGTGEQAVWFAMANTSGTAMTFTITSTNYRTDGPWTYQVPAGGTVSDYFNAVAFNGGWYDFTVTLDADPSWSRRFTGHLETGAASVTG